MPIWPADGRHPSGKKDQHVYFDERTNEVVVSILAGTINEGGPPTSIDFVERQQLNIAVCPFIAASGVAKETSLMAGTGIYNYSYTFGNGAGARQDIGSVTLAGMAGMSITTPRGWGSSAVERASAPENLLRYENISWGPSQVARLRSMSTERRITWFARASDSAIAPDATLGPFTIQANARPGILKAYFRGVVPRGSIPISGRSTWDMKTYGQLGSLNNFENNSISTPLLGPKFLPSVADQLIADDYLKSIDRLLQEGKLTKDSAFVQEAMEILKAVANSNKGAATPGLAIKWRTSPESGLERDIRLGISICLEH